MRARVFLCLLVCIVAVCVTLVSSQSSACHIPIIYLVQPAPGDSEKDALSSLVTIEARVRDGLDIASIDVLLDAKALATVSKAPYRSVWDTAKVANGPHYLQARGHLADGSLIGSPLVKVVVKNTAPSPSGD